MKSTIKRIELDWSNLFGFNQIKSTKAALDTKNVSALGAKLGTKLGGKIGTKAGVKVVR